MLWEGDDSKEVGIGGEWFGVGVETVVVDWLSAEERLEIAVEIVVEGRWEMIGTELWLKTEARMAELWASRSRGSGELVEAAKMKEKVKEEIFLVGVNEELKGVEMLLDGDLFLFCLLLFVWLFDLFSAGKEGILRGEGEQIEISTAFRRKEDVLFEIVFFGHFIKKL